MLCSGFPLKMYIWQHRITFYSPYKNVSIFKCLLLTNCYGFFVGSDAVVH